MAGINDIDSSIQNLIKMTNAKVALTKLWENASPGSSFTAQKLAVNTSGYDMLVYVCNLSTTYNQRFIPWAMTVLNNSAFCVYTNIGRTMTWESKTTIDMNLTESAEVGAGTIMNMCDAGSIYRRNVTYQVNGLTISGVDGTKISGVVNVTDNRYLIPVEIYGIKSSGGVLG